MSTVLSEGLIKWLLWIPLGWIDTYMLFSNGILMRAYWWRKSTEVTLHFPIVALASVIFRGLFLQLSYKILSLWGLLIWTLFNYVHVLLLLMVLIYFYILYVYSPLILWLPYDCLLIFTALYFLEFHCYIGLVIYSASSSASWALTDFFTKILISNIRVVVLFRGQKGSQLEYSRILTHARWGVSGVARERRKAELQLSQDF